MMMFMELATADTDFAKFVASQQAIPSTEPEIDWHKERDQYIKDVATLFERISSYLKSYIENDSIRISYDDVEISEEKIGTYRIARMRLEIGRQLVVLEPVGTLLIGSRGRVDVIGSSGRTPILLINAAVKRASDLIHVTVSLNGEMPPPPPKREEPIIWEWKVVDPQSRMSFVTLDQKALFAILLEVGKA